MKNRKIPMRSCVVTHEKLEKRDLIRIVKNKEGQIFVDTTGKQNGKGCYLKKEEDVIETAQEKKVLDRVLEAQVPDTIYDELKVLVKK